MKAAQHSELIAAAKKARENAQAPFSGFKVGAALRGRDGTIYTGCNIENSTYGLTVCAERVAIFKALSEGAAPRSFDVMAIVADTEVLTPPCGACRQLLWEFCGEMPLVIANLKGQAEEQHTLTLLPKPFDAGFFR
ncbi:MAG: cytidine deaminase [Acidobacteriales bacterium]|nr:cytidine deaminase [Terriglobales bacterium]